MAANHKDTQTTEEVVTSGDDVSNTNSAVETDNKPDWAVKAEAAGYERKRTIGEQKFDQRAYIGWAGIGTFILSVAIAYIVKDGRMNIPFYKNKNGESVSFRDKYNQITKAGADQLIKRNIIKNPSEKYDIETKRMVVDKTAEDRALKVSGQAMLTTATFIGGFLPLPIIRYMERNKAKIVRRLNEKHGTAEDVAIGEQNVKDEAPQSWGSIAKGRIAAWLIVFASFAGIGDKLIPNTFGGMTKDGERIFGKIGKLLPFNKWPKGSDEYFKASSSKDPTTNRGPEDDVLGKISPSEKAKKQMYAYKRNGNISGVDIFATAMSASLLYVASKFFARKKEKKEIPHQAIMDQTNLPHIRKAVADNAAQQVTENTEIMPKNKHRNIVEQRTSSFVSEEEKQALAAESSTSEVQTGV